MLEIAITPGMIATDSDARLLENLLDNAVC
jgi:hypothetical protein